MKLLPFLLAAIIMLLGMKPGIDHISPFEVLANASCCDSHCELTAEDGSSDKHPPSPASQKQPCNPFQFCMTSCCALFNFSWPQPNLSNPLESSEFITFYRAEFSSLTLSDIWRPPGIA